MKYLSVSKFSEYQHYRNRKPPWVKFYVTLLDPQHPLNDLPIPTRYLFDRLLLLAAEWNNSIPNDSELIGKLTRMDERDCREGLAQLVKGRWLREKHTKRTASRPASTSASKSLPPEREKELEKEPPIVPLHRAPKAESKKRGSGWVEDLFSYTGCKLVRGQGGMGHVYDVLGKDRPPSDWPHERPSRNQIAEALKARTVA